MWVCLFSGTHQNGGLLFLGLPLKPQKRQNAPKGGKRENHQKGGCPFNEKDEPPGNGTAAVAAVAAAAPGGLVHLVVRGAGAHASGEPLCTR